MRASRPYELRSELSASKSLHRSPDLSQDQGIQPGRDVAEQGRTERVNASSPLEGSTPFQRTTAPEPMPSITELSKTARNERDRVTRKHPLPLYQSFLEGERLELHDPVVFLDHVVRCFVYCNAGAYQLLVDRHVGRETWVIRTDQYSGQRRDLLVEWIATHLGTHRLLFSPIPIRVYGVTGGRDQVPPDEMMAMDLLRLFAREEATHYQARTVSKNALNRIVRGPKETFAAAA